MFSLLFICEECIIVLSFRKLKLRDLLKIVRLLMAEVRLPQPSSAQWEGHMGYFSLPCIAQALYQGTFLGRETYDRWISEWKDGGTDG